MSSPAEPHYQKQFYMLCPKAENAASTDSVLSYKASPHVSFNISTDLNRHIFFIDFLLAWDAVLHPYSTYSKTYVFHTSPAVIDNIFASIRNIIILKLYFACSQIVFMLDFVLILKQLSKK